MFVLFRRRRLLWLKLKCFWRATYTLLTTHILLLCQHLHSLYSGVLTLHWLCGDLTTWPSLKVLYLRVIKDSCGLSLACSWSQMFCCICRWLHSLESYWQYCNWWRHVHGLQRWPLPIRYPIVNQLINLPAVFNKIKTFFCFTSCVSWSWNDSLWSTHLHTSGWRGIGPTCS